MNLICPVFMLYTLALFSSLATARPDHPGGTIHLNRTSEDCSTHDALSQQSYVIPGCPPPCSSLRLPAPPWGAAIHTAHGPHSTVFNAPKTATLLHGRSRTTVQLILTESTCKAHKSPLHRVQYSGSGLLPPRYWFSRIFSPYPSLSHHTQKRKKKKLKNRSQIPHTHTPEHRARCSPHNTGSTK